MFHLIWGICSGRHVSRARIHTPQLWIDTILGGTLHRFDWEARSLEDMSHKLSHLNIMNARICASNIMDWCHSRRHIDSPWCHFRRRIDSHNTGWRRPMGCLICIGHFPQQNPIIGVSFAKRDLHLKASYASLPSCSLYDKRHIDSHDILSAT